jgi:hypothetical protein
MNQPLPLVAIVFLAFGAGFVGCEFRPARTLNASSKEALSQMHENIQIGDSQEAVRASINSLKTDRISVRTNAFQDTWEVSMPRELGAGDWMLFVQFGSNRMVLAVALRTSDGIYLKPKGAPEDKGNFLPPRAE